MAFTYFEWASPTGPNIVRTGISSLDFYASPASESIASATVTVYNAATNAQLYRTTVRADGTAQDGGAVIHKISGGGSFHYNLYIYGRVALVPYVTSGQSVIIGLSVTASGGGTTSEIRVTKTVYDPPALTITSPTSGEVVDALPLVITWDATDATGISYQSLWIQGGSGENWVELQYEPASDERSIIIAASDGIVVNDESYKLSYRALNGAGIAARDQVTFTTHWAPPATPTVRTGTNHADLSVGITVFEGYIDGTEPATASLMVTRINPDGTRWVVASDLRSGETCVDPLPPLGVEYSYAVTAVTEAGTTSVATVTHTVESAAWAFNFGASAGEVLQLYGNPKASYSLDQGGEAYHFADGGAGGGLPVWYGTTDRDESGTLAFDTVGPQDTDRLRELCRQYPVGWIRDPFGHRWRAHVQPKISHGKGDLWAASVTWDAVRYREAW